MGRPGQLVPDHSQWRPAYCLGTPATVLWVQIHYYVYLIYRYIHITYMYKVLCAWRWASLNCVCLNNSLHVCRHSFLSGSTHKPTNTSLSSLCACLFNLSSVQGEDNNECVCVCVCVYDEKFIEQFTQHRCEITNLDVSTVGCCQLTKTHGSKRPDLLFHIYVAWIAQ